MIATTATYLCTREIAIKIAKHLEHNQIIVLNPGRTGGALEFKNIIDISGIKKRIYISEAQTLVYACRLIETGLVNIIGVKSHVLISALPASDTQHILEILNPIFGCFLQLKMCCKPVLRISEQCFIHSRIVQRSCNRTWYTILFLSRHD